MTEADIKFMNRAVELSRLGMQSRAGGPFGCVIVKDGNIVGEGCNMVTTTNDPTAHAEVVAIRDACNNLGTFQLNGCDIYASCEPCPMCLGAIYWARPSRVIFANTKDDAAAIEFDDRFIYEEIEKDHADRLIKFFHMPHAGAKEVFREWNDMQDKIEY
jgi:tRNA(Arg) A34 adenosine deaminase TadA